ncbi:hypothetical protein [Streptosporangium roseum]|uniref:hypothetical protein n=1 Tax=Streptosporangium roseum TaxID=2001 RepID=UPI0012DC805E|nr:hypothetical protein [Streptosporangium roseum]
MLVRQGLPTASLLFIGLPEKGAFSCRRRVKTALPPELRDRVDALLRHDEIDQQELSAPLDEAARYGSGGWRRIKPEELEEEWLRVQELVRRSKADRHSLADDDCRNE